MKLIIYGIYEILVTHNIQLDIFYHIYDNNFYSLFAAIIII